MISLLKGKILNVKDDYLVLDVNGVGYKVEHNAPFRLGLEGSKVSLHIYTHVRENELRLFGFGEEIELRLFEKLLTVSGIGPKSAMQIISTHSPMQIITAINNNDPSLITVKGVGLKSLAKIAIELKGKLEDLEQMVPTRTHAQKEDKKSQIEISSQQEELAQALDNLGFQKRYYKAILSKIDHDVSFSDQVKQALKLLNT
jgi:Holliday junction DNA helicase RuvA